MQNIIFNFFFLVAHAQVASNTIAMPPNLVPDALAFVGNLFTSWEQLIAIVVAVILGTTAIGILINHFRGH